MNNSKTSKIKRQFSTSTPNSSLKHKLNDDSRKNVNKNVSKKTKLINDDDEDFTHAVVNWLCDNKYSLVQKAKIISDGPIIEGEVYKIPYKSSKTAEPIVYDAKILLLGSYDECKKRLDKMPRKTSARLLEDQSINESQNQVQQSPKNQDSSVYKVKIAELQCLLNEKSKEIKSLRETIDSLNTELCQVKQKNNDLLQLTQDEEKNKVIAYCKKMINCLASSHTSNTSSSSNIQLYSKYPSILVSSIFFNEISDQRDKDNRKISDTSLFRKILRAIIPVDDFKKLNGGKDLVKLYPNHIDAAYRKFTLFNMFSY